MAAKLVVTNRSALAAKYGNLKTVDAALDRLIAADAGRGLKTQVIDIADGPTMKRLKGPTASPADQASNKAAIDAAFRRSRPSYLVILGADDVVPHQSLDNPLRSSDGDQNVPSDLPYACETPSSIVMSDFIAPTRVVTRLPDRPGASRPELLIRLLDNVAKWAARPVSQYQPLGISAAKWKGSSGLSLTHLFGSAAALQLVPPAGPHWDRPTLARRIHFINCHGAIEDPQFYGQLAKRYPIAHQSNWLKGRITNGTVVAAECCYGAELYDSGRGALPICLRYLDEGAYTVFGSTNTAYGSEDNTNTDADLLTQYFIRSILKGASVGRAGLEARQAFIAALPHPDPFDLKTLAQYLILGDGSIHPVAAAVDGSKRRSAKRVSHGSASAKSVRTGDRRTGLAKAMPDGITARRVRLREQGAFLSDTVRPVAELARVADRSSSLVALLRELAPDPDLRVHFATYQPALATRARRTALHTAGPTAARGMKGLTPSAPRIRFQVASVSRLQPIEARGVIAVVGREENGALTSVRTVVSR